MGKGDGSLVCEGFFDEGLCSPVRAFGNWEGHSGMENERDGINIVRDDPRLRVSDAGQLSSNLVQIVFPREFLKINLNSSF
jgi:hypothetical protein